ncbi:MAG TPA: glycosyltransferase family 39 protein [Verrucomicrobiae bacterium]|nr:glycosyltransferase family 39 protein [Verrucomicrobiae bacterium]
MVSLPLMPAVSFTRRQRMLVAASVIFYGLLRVVLIPADPSITENFSHDSAYNSIVADNLLHGKGLTNDAHWLIFLNPPKLPMPFHNANPLYVLLSAAVAGAWHCSTPYAACIVSILGSILLGIGIHFCVRRFCPNDWIALLCAAGVVLFPSNWKESFAIVPDALATALCYCTVAAVVWSTRSWHWLAAGAAFGLAWLTRSTATLILPAVFLWLFLKHGLRRSLVAMMLFLVAALAVASPWLYHTAITRGSPFASDAGYYWLQNFYAARNGITVDQYWRSVAPPPGIGYTLTRSFFQLADFTIRGVRPAVWLLAAGLADSYKPWFALLSLAALAGVLCLRGRWRNSEMAAACLIAVLTLFSISVRAAGAEPRYFSVANCLLALLILQPFLVRRPRPIWILAPVSAYLVLALVPQDIRAIQHARRPFQALVTYKAMATEAAENLSRGDSVITDWPYWFTYYTGHSAISPPYPGRSELFGAMRRYHAAWLLLPQARIDYYYPGSPGKLAPELTVAKTVGNYVLMKTTRDFE